jgi:hypothetical protein
MDDSVLAALTADRRVIVIVTDAVEPRRDNVPPYDEYSI